MKTILLLLIAVSVQAQPVRQNGGGSSSVDAGSITNGPLASSVLPSTVAYTNRDNNWSATQTFQGTATVQGNAFSVGSSTFVVSAGKVGIGTTSPGSAFDVAGSASFRDQATVVGSMTVVGEMLVGSASILRATEARIATRIRIPEGGIDVNGTSGIGLGDARVLGWSSNSDGAGAEDIGLSRGRAGVMYVGQGTNGTFNGTVVVSSAGIGTPFPVTAFHLSSGTLTIDGTGSPTKNSALCLTTAGTLGACDGLVGADGTCTCTSP